MDKKSDSDKNNVRNLKIQFNKDEKMKKDILIKKKKEKEIKKNEKEVKERLLKDIKRFILFIYVMYIYSCMLILSYVHIYTCLYIYAYL